MLQGCSNIASKMYLFSSNQTVEPNAGLLAKLIVSFVLWWFFSKQFGVCDDSGVLSLWQVGMNTPAVTKPYWVSSI